MECTRSMDPLISSLLTFLSPISAAAVSEHAREVQVLDHTPGPL
jgi:hypothetical protein